MNVLLVSNDPVSLADLSIGLKRYPEMKLCQVAHWDAALAKCRKTPFSLVVLDEEIDGRNGIALARTLVAVDPIITTAVVSRLSPSAFHDASEGLGLLMALPPKPDASVADRLMERLQRAAIS